MNVTYDKINSTDFAKIIGVAPQTITSWVRAGLLRATNVGDGTDKARYLFSDNEVTRVQHLIAKYGSRKWMLYSKEELKADSNKKKKEVVVMDVPVIVRPEPKPEPEISPRRFNADRVMNKILKLQDLKEELENLEAERNQLLGEIELLRKEIMEVI